MPPSDAAALAIRSQDLSGRLVALDAAPEHVLDGWEQLAERCEAGPYAHPGLVRLWASVFAAGPLTLATVERGGELVAALPLLRRGRRVSGTANWHLPEIAPLALDDAAADTLLDTVFAARPRHVALPFLGTADAERVRAAAARAGYRTSQRALLRSPYREIAGDWEAFEAAMPSRRRSEMRRLRRRLEEQGTLELAVEDGSERLLDELVALEARSWKGESGTAIVQRDDTRRFYAGLTSWAASRGWARFYVLRLDGRAVAIAFGLEAHGVHHGVKMGVDPELRRAGPGIVLVHELVRHLHEAGMRRFDMGGDEDAYKREWCPETHERVELVAFAPTLGGRADRLGHLHGRRVARRLHAERLVRGLLPDQP